MDIFTIAFFGTLLMVLAAGAALFVAIVVALIVDLVRNLKEKE